MTTNREIKLASWEIAEGALKNKNNAVVEKLESRESKIVQRKIRKRVVFSHSVFIGATRIVIECKNKNYAERLKIMNLTTFETRTRADLLKVFNV